MKTSISNLIFAALFLLASFSLQANTPPLLSNSFNEDVIREGFVSKLERPSDRVLQFSEETALVHFTINTMNEIVILTTGTNNPELDAFIKRTLNYERIDTKNILIERDYYIKVTFKKSNFERTIL